MLLSISINNFKCFEKIDVDNFKPITILTGNNNVGKSSIFQAFIFLKKSVENKIFDWGLLNLSSYKDTVYQQIIGNKITIQCIFSLEEAEKNFLKKYLVGNLKSISHSVTINSNSKIVEECILIDGKTLLKSTNTDKKTIKLFLNKLIKYKSKANVTFEKVKLSSFSDSYPLSWAVQYSLLEKMEELSIISSIIEFVKAKYRNIDYISDRRRIDSKVTSIVDEPENVGFDGNFSSVKLLYLFTDRSKIFDDIERWVKKIDPEIEMLKTPLIQGKTTIELKTALADVNIMTVGSGLKTALPVIMQSQLTPDYGSLIIEEPEIHLHPGAQKILIDLFIDCIQNNKQVIFTTHSFDILLELYKRIKSHGFDEKDVCIWGIKRNNNSSRTTQRIDSYNEVFKIWRSDIRTVLD